MFRLLTLSMVALTINTAHAASLCPAGTRTVVITDTTPDFPIVVMPSSGGDYDENNPVQTFDVSGAKTTQFVAHCNPNEEGRAGITDVPLPLGISSCTFDKATGSLTCQ